MCSFEVAFDRSEMLDRRLRGCSTRLLDVNSGDVLIREREKSMISLRLVEPEKGLESRDEMRRKRACVNDLHSLCGSKISDAAANS